MNIVLWILQVLTAAAFFMAGGSKLVGEPMMVQVFDKVGVGQWFRYMTGILEVGSALLLLTPKFSGIGAGILIPVMIGAIIAHLTVLGGAPTSPAVLLVLCCIIAWGRRDQIQRLLK